MGYPSRTKHGATHPVVPTISSPFSPASLLPPAMSSTTRLVPLRRPLFPPLNQVRYNTRSPDQERRTLRLHNRKRNHLEKPTKKTDGYTLAGHHADIVRRQLELGTQPLFPKTFVSLPIQKYLGPEFFQYLAPVQSLGSSLCLQLGPQMAKRRYDFWPCEMEDEQVQDSADRASIIPRSLGSVRRRGRGYD